MELNNYLNKLATIQGEKEAWVVGYIYMIQALYPFVPHICSEVWERLETHSGLLSKLNLNHNVSD